MELLSLKTAEGPGECAICYEVYRICPKSRAPKTLQCGHSLCLHCLRKLVCHSLLMTFAVCPFCRSVTIIPEEGVQALKTDEETLRRASLNSEALDDVQSDSSGFSSGRASPSLSEPHTPRHSLPRHSIFTISESVDPSEDHLWGGRYMQEIRSTYLLGITRRVELSEATHPSPSAMSFSADSMRLCFALGLIISLACVFFIFIFFK